MDFTILVLVSLLDASNTAYLANSLQKHRKAREISGLIRKVKGPLLLDHYI